MPATILGQVLVEAGLVDESIVNDLEAEHPGSPAFAVAVVEGRVLGEDQLRQAICLNLGLPPANLRKMRIPGYVAKILDRRLAERLLAIPVSTRKEGDEEVLFVAFFDPTDGLVIDEVRRATGRHVRPVAATLSEVREAITRYMRPLRVDSVPPSAGMKPPADILPGASSDPGRATPPPLPAGGGRVPPRSPGDSRGDTAAIFGGLPAHGAVSAIVDLGAEAPGRPVVLKDDPSPATLPPGSGKGGLSSAAAETLPPTPVPAAGPHPEADEHDFSDIFESKDGNPIERPPAPAAAGRRQRGGDFGELFAEEESVDLLNEDGGFAHSHEGPAAPRGSSRHGPLLDARALEKLTKEDYIVGDSGGSPQLVGSVRAGPDDELGLAESVWRISDEPSPRGSPPPHLDAAASRLALDEGTHLGLDERRVVDEGTHLGFESTARPVARGRATRPDALPSEPLPTAVQPEDQISLPSPSTDSLPAVSEGDRLSLVPTSTGSLPRGDDSTGRLPPIPARGRAPVSPATTAPMGVDTRAAAGRTMLGTGVGPASAAVIPGSAGRTVFGTGPAVDEAIAMARRVTTPPAPARSDPVTGEEDRLLDSLLGPALDPFPNDVATGARVPRRGSGGAAGQGASGSEEGRSRASRTGDDTLDPALAASDRHGASRVAETADKLPGAGASLVDAALSAMDVDDMAELWDLDLKTEVPLPVPEETDAEKARPRLPSAADGADAAPPAGAGASDGAPHSDSLDLDRLIVAPIAEQARERRVALEAAGRRMGLGRGSLLDALITDPLGVLPEETPQSVAQAVGVLARALIRKGILRKEDLLD